MSGPTSLTSAPATPKTRETKKGRQPAAKQVLPPHSTERNTTIMTLTPIAPARTEPPHDLAAEQAVLGAILTAPDRRRAHELLGEVLELAPPATWYRPAHALLLDHLTALADADQPLDAITLHDRLAKTGDHTRTGGAPYLHTLVEQAAVGATVGHYARIIAEKAVLRRLIQAGARITQFGQQATPGADVDDLVERARDEVDSIVRTGSAHDPEVTTLADGLAGFLDRLERGDAVADVIPVPYADLADKLVGGGFAPGQLVVIAGRPGHGKTTIALDIMRHAAKKGKRVLFHSLEMTRDELDIKLAAAETGIATTQLTPGPNGVDLTDDQWRRLADYVGRAADMDITIDEAAECSLSRIKARVNAMERQGRLPHLVVVDYIQLMDTAPAERRDLRIAALSRGLKILAKTKKIVVVALAQARRESADRENGVPRLSDLAESSALEKDPNIVLTVATPHVDDLEHERAGETIINVAKNRGGPLGEVGLACQFHYSRCANLHR